MTSIAIIEDDKTMNNYLKSLIETISSVTVSQYFNLADAETAVQNQHFDLIILDIELGQTPKEKLGGIRILNLLSGKKV